MENLLSVAPTNSKGFKVEFPSLLSKYKRIKFASPSDTIQLNQNTAQDKNKK
jgi:hypothetical protein